MLSLFTVLSQFLIIVYSDDGPDRNVTFLAYKIYFISLFVKHELNILQQSEEHFTSPGIKNPAERVMTVINVALAGSWPDETGP